MIMAEMTAFDNLEELTGMAKDLTTFVREAVVEGTAAHEVTGSSGELPQVLLVGSWEASSMDYPLQPKPAASVMTRLSWRS